jgi:transposase
MARPAEVFVRSLSNSEGQKLQRITRRSKDPVRLRRAAVVMMFGQGQSVADIAHLWQSSPDWVRSVIHAFNESGFDALDPKWSGGRSPKLDAVTRQRVAAMAKTDPRALSLPFSRWSLSKLADHLHRERICDIGRETLRGILHDEGVSWQATQTWKGSNDPDFVPKMRRILDLYDHPPEDGRVVCADEFGPLNLQPRPGKGWWARKAAKKLRATYRRDGGVRHMLAALDLSTGEITYRIKERKRWREWLAFLKTLRARWPTDRIYLIVDNFSPHKKRQVTDYCEANDIELVFTPTNASWLNWIEAEFAAIREFALNGTDHRSHAEQGKAIADYIRWHNQNARPKEGFAINSKIRHPDYRPKVPG